MEVEEDEIVNRGSGSEGEEENDGLGDFIENDRQDLFGSDDEEGQGQKRRRDSGSIHTEDEEEKEKEKAAKDAEAAKKPVKPKRVGPPKRILLSEEELCGAKGIPKLFEMMKDFKFGGKGREKADLDLMLHKLEQWSHNLNAKYVFSQNLERIEFLGTKKRSVKVALKKIRWGLTDIGQDNVVRGEPEDEENLADMLNEAFEGEEAANNGVEESNNDNEKPEDDGENLTNMLNEAFEGDDDNDEINAVKITEKEMKKSVEDEEDLEDMLKEAFEEEAEETVKIKTVEESIERSDGEDEDEENLVEMANEAFEGEETTVNIGEQTTVNINEQTTVNINEQTTVNINEQTTVNIREQTTVNINEQTTVNINEQTTVNIVEKPEEDDNENLVDMLNEAFDGDD